MRLAELLDLDVLRRLADANYKASGMPIGIVDAVDGSILVGAGWQEICTMYHRVHAVTAARCRESDDHIRAHLSQEEPCEYRCKNGLRDIGIPIVVAGTHLATLFMGQFFYAEESPDRDFFVRQARQYGFDEEAYLRALDRVPVFSRSAIENVLAYNAALARFISDVAEGALRQREANALAASLGRFPEENPDPVLRVSADGRVLYANEAARLRLRPLQVAVGRVAPDEIAQPAARAMARGTRQTTEVACADETFALTVLPVGGAVNVYGYEVTSRKRVEEALRRSEEQARAQAVELAAIFNSVADGIVVYDREGRTVHSTPSADRILGIPASERRAPLQERVREQYEITSEDGRLLGPDEMAAVRAAVRGELVKDEVVRLRTGTREPRWIRMNATPLIVDGEHTGAVLSISDITERKRAEEAIRASERGLRALADSMPQLAWTARPDGYITWYNRRWYEYTGTSPAQMEGWGWQAVHDPATLPSVLERWQRSIATGQSFEMEFPLRAADGTFRRFLTRVFPLKDDFGQVLQWFGTNTDVTALVEAQEALRQADQRKDEFLGMLSHELRNPLAPIRNAVYLLRHADASGEQARRAQRIIERQTEHLTRLVDDLLDVTRIARGKIQLRPERIDLREVVARAADDFRLAMDDRGVAFHTDLPHSAVWADADPTRITQVVGNLLHNAAKFTHRGAEVTLSLRLADDVAEILVRDTGAGIDPALLPRVFEPFVQGERTLARTEGGLGLGLALVEGIARLHGGTVSADSAGQGSGATFRVRLPVVVARAAQERGAAAAERRMRGRRVLVVDDNTDAAESLADVVNVLGYEVDVAFDGPSALERIRASPPDVLLCDLGLPGMDGYEIARRIRADGAGAIQLIAVSGYAQPEDVRRALEAGFDAHVAKPPDPAEIERLLS